jgi:hypothetical protein
MKSIDNYNFHIKFQIGVRDELVWECLYVCNQNFDQQKYFCCVAQSDEIWMVWNFHKKKSNEENDVISHIFQNFSMFIMLW